MWHIEAQVKDNSYAYASEIILACIKNITVVMYSLTLLSPWNELMPITSRPIIIGTALA
jgi:hypothetical protein